MLGKEDQSRKAMFQSVADLILSLAQEVSLHERTAN
jgi:hypothetical protein